LAKFNPKGLGKRLFSLSYFIVFTDITIAVQVAPTIYYMCKVVERGIVTIDIKILEKSGGKSGGWKAF
jgi:hypothetical protein